MKINFILFLMLLMPSYAYAECVDRDFSHIPSCERFTILDDTSQTAHFFAGITIVTLSTLTLKKLGVKPVSAILSSVALAMILSAGKEMFIDKYVSRNGITSGWVGAVTGGIAMTVFEF